MLDCKKCLKAGRPNDFPKDGKNGLSSWTCHNKRNARWQADNPELCRRAALHLEGS